MLQKDGTLSIGGGVCERPDTCKIRASWATSVCPSSCLPQCQGRCQQLKSSVLCRNKSYMIHARAVSPEEGNSLKWPRGEWEGGRRSCLSTSTGDPASGVCVMAGGHSEGFVHIVFIQQVWSRERHLPLGKAASQLLLDTQAANIPPPQKALV